jgi:hypothetical protein
VYTAIAHQQSHQVLRRLVMPMYTPSLLQVSDVRDHSLRKKLLLLLSLLLLSQQLCLQLRVTQLSLSSISSNALKSTDQLLLSLRDPAPNVQPSGMSTENVVPNQPLVMLLLPRSQTDLRPTTTDTLQIGIVRLRLRETVRMRVKYVLMVLQLLYPVSEELVRIVRRSIAEVRQPVGQSLCLRERLQWILARDRRWVSPEGYLLWPITQIIWLLLTLGVYLLCAIAINIASVLHRGPVGAELLVQMLG